MKKKLAFVAGSLAALPLVAWSVLNITYDSTLDFELYQHESYKGSKAAEMADFIAAGAKVLRAQEFLQSQAKGGEKLRVFHAKQHGCLTAKFRLLEDRPADLDHKTF